MDYLFLSEIIRPNNKIHAVLHAYICMYKLTYDKCNAILAFLMYSQWMNDECVHCVCRKSTKYKISPCSGYFPSFQLVIISAQPHALSTVYIHNVPIPTRANLGILPVFAPSL